MFDIYPFFSPGNEMNLSLTLITFFIGIGIVITNKVTYTFVEYPYKESNKNEIIYREVEAACEKNCLGRHGLQKVLCIRQCMSPTCFRDLYQSDLLEEGEVDVRLNSFKGCFIQRYNRSQI